MSGYRLLSLALWSCGLAGGCAREILPLEQLSASSDDDAEPPDGEDAGMTAPDGSEGTPDSAQGTPDAAHSTPDASCADGDHDGVCDAQDNCPTTSNPNQADANKDGVGDGCTTACNFDALMQSVRAGDGTLSQISINGGGNTASVKAGATINVSGHYEFDECSIVETAQMRFVVDGFEGGQASCGRLPTACPLPGSGMGSFTLTAPSKSGPYYIVAKGVQAYTCSESLTGTQRIAAICVQ